MKDRSCRPEGGSAKIGFDQVILAIDTPDFDSVLVRSVRAMAGADLCFITLVAPERNPECVGTGGTISQQLARDLATAYVDEFYRDDPNLERIYNRRGTARMLLLPGRLPDDYDTRYRERFFESAGVFDKFATAAWHNGRWLYSNFYRLSDKDPFSKDDFDIAMGFGPLVAAAITRHFALQRRRTRPELLELLATELPFCLLAARERTVCVHILQGFTSEAIALRLGISINSVLSYRKRAYAKLAISSINELFALALTCSGRVLAVNRGDRVSPLGMT